MPVIRSGKRVIISTGTKNLQEQLFHKDIPFLEQALFPDGEGKLNVCYMKGRNNYLCRKKLYDLTDQPVLSGLEEIEHYRAIAAWEKTTATGDRAELARCQKPARFGTNSMPAPTPVSDKSAAHWIAALSPKCADARRRATSSSSIIIYFLPISASSSSRNTRPTPAFFPKSER